MPLNLLLTDLRGGLCTLSNVVALRDRFEVFWIDAEFPPTGVMHYVAIGYRADE